MVAQFSWHPLPSNEHEFKLLHSLKFQKKIFSLQGNKVYCIVININISITGKISKHKNELFKSF